MVQLSPSREIADLNSAKVIISTDLGIPISIGRLVVTGSGARQRVDLHFETERLGCVLRVSPEKWPALLEQWDGETTRYVLTHGDGFWLDEHNSSKRRVTDVLLSAGLTKPAFF